MSESPRIAFVTGGGRGIGRACALQLARGGFDVAVGGRSAAHLAETVSAIQGVGRRALAVDLDVTRESSVSSAFDAARRELGPVAVLVNNAGIALSRPFAKTTLDEFQQVLGVNLTGAFLCTQAVLPGMLEAGWGRIINIASTAARIGFRYTAAYCASKHGLLGLTRALALEVARKGVTVNAICPGWTDTEMLAASVDTIHAATGASRDDARETLARMNPMGRIVQPDEVAALVAYVASDAASAMTGQALGIDGGEAM